MPNPYRGRPAHCFWRQAVAEAPADGVDPVTAMPFAIAPGDAVATIGSCFVQHLSRVLTELGLRFLVTERFAGAPGTVDENYGAFPARFGNVYTARQLRQLLDRAYGLYRPRLRPWALPGGGVADPFRPRIQADGFPDPALLAADADRHLAAVRAMVEGCDVLIVTLGLTEGWVEATEGAAVPLHPGVLGVDGVGEWRFVNDGVAATLAEMEAFLAGLRAVNPGIRVMLTVSPVHLAATAQDRHVLVSSMASKAVLRAVVEELCRRDPGLAYFPAYEIIAGPQAGGRYYADDLRQVRPEGVARVMALFRRHCLAPAATPAAEPAYPTAAELLRYRALLQVVCDEEANAAAAGA